jgi:cell volume regulation protein A
MVWIFKLPWIDALLIGAVLAPTDAAAVNTLLRAARVAVPARVAAALEVESGLNDPMSVFLTVLLVEMLAAANNFTATHAMIFFLQEMIAGAILGVLGGFGLLRLLRKLPVPASIYPVLALTSVLVVFGGAQVIGASGFLAVYLVGIIVRLNRFESQRAVIYASEAFAWLAQIALFLMLGLLVTPHQLIPLVQPILLITAVLVLIARPVATFVCLLPFGYSARETAFASWVGLRGAVPIYLTIIPVLAGSRNAPLLFGATFGVVIVSLVLQGWTISPAGEFSAFANCQRKRLVSGTTSREKGSRLLQSRQEDSLLRASCRSSTHLFLIFLQKPVFQTNRYISQPALRWFARKPLFLKRWAVLNPGRRLLTAPEYD